MYVQLIEDISGITPNLNHCATFPFFWGTPYIFFYVIDLCKQNVTTSADNNI